MQRISVKHHLAIFGVIILYAFIGIFLKLIGNAIPIMTVSFLRFFFGVITLGVLIPFLDPASFHTLRKYFWHYLFMGFLLAADIVTFNLAMYHSSVSMVTLLSADYVFLAAILAYFMLNEHLTLRCLLAIIGGIIGIAILNPLHDPNTLGNIFALISGAIYAFFIVYLRKDERTHTLGMMFWILLFAALWTLPFPFIYGVGTLSGYPLLWMILLGVFCTGIAYLLLDYGMEEVDTDTTAVLLLVFHTVVAIALAMLILHEPITARTYIGGAILLAAGLAMELKCCASWVMHRR